MTYHSKNVYESRPVNGGGIKYTITATERYNSNEIIARVQRCLEFMKANEVIEKLIIKMVI